jgi:hypothetical protein
MKKRGQVTIFVIAGIIVVILAALFFIFRQDVLPNSGGKTELNPSREFSSCIEESVRENINLISSQGGYASNKLNLSFQFTDEEKVDISYLCYQQNYYLSCINQQPMLINHLKKEIKNQINSDVESCFNKVVSSLENSGETVEDNYRGFDVNLYEDRVVVNVDGEINTEKSGATAKYSGLKSVVYTRFYNLAIVAQEIVSQEARFCNFEQVGYTLIYNEFNIDKFRTGNSDTIYTITSKKSGEIFRFAVRSCVIPPGF